MAIDTPEKRLSAMATRRLPWFRRFQPRPSGSVGAEDRKQVSLVYVGIASLPPEVEMPTIIVSATVTYGSPIEWTTEYVDVVSRVVIAGESEVVLF